LLSFIRYSDFIVNEVDPLGNVIHLTNINAPVEVILSVYLFLNFSWFHSYPCYFLTVSFFSYTFSSGFNRFKCREDSSFVSSMQNLLRYTHTQRAAKKNVAKKEPQNKYQLNSCTQS
jgi:hypothetical protein